MYDMHVPNIGAHDPNTGSSVKQNYICSSECENNVLHQQLPNLSLKYFKVGTPGTRASDVVPLLDNQTRGWSPWPDIGAHDLLLNFYFATVCMIPDVFICLQFTSFYPQNSFADSHTLVFHPQF